MSEAKFVLTPVSQNGKAVAQLPWNETIESIKDYDHYVDYLINGKQYKVNMGAIRLRVIKKSPVCACCGIQATDIFLDLDSQQTDELGKPFYHINFYARNNDGNKIHLVLMTKDHILPRSKGGRDVSENCQVLCYNCNTLKGSMELNLEQMKSMLFPAYRAYCSTSTLNKAKDLLRPYYRTIELLEKSMVNITNAINIVKDERQLEIKEKLASFTKEAATLVEFCKTFEFKAQTTGVVPEIPDNIKAILRRG